MSESKPPARFIGALMLFASVLPAYAGNIDVIVNGKSHHMHSHYDWNEDNLGIGVEYEFERHSRWIRSVNANAFKDSLDNISYMAGAGLRRRLIATGRFGGMYVDAGLVAFLMSREDINDRRPFPGILPVLSFGNQYAGINLTYLPQKAVHDIAHANVVDPTIGGILFMQLKLPLHVFGFN